MCLFFFQAEDGIRDVAVTGVQTCALPICREIQKMSHAAWSPLRRRGSETSLTPTNMLTVARIRTTAVPAAKAAEAPARLPLRSEERRVGKECRSRWWPE